MHIEEGHLREFITFADPLYRLYLNYYLLQRLNGGIGLLKKDTDEFRIFYAVCFQERNEAERETFCQKIFRFLCVIYSCYNWHWTFTQLANMFVGMISLLSCNSVGLATMLHNHFFTDGADLSFCEKMTIKLIFIMYDTCKRNFR